MYIYNKYANIKLPKTYIRCGKKCYLDLYRRKLILITPEEIVRQKTAIYFNNDIGVPKEVIKLEERLSHYGVNSNKRADIVIHKYSSDGMFYPVGIIECKAESVELSDNVAKQAFNYADILGCEYAFITNGYEIRSFKYIEKEKRYIRLEKVPSYKEMINGKYVEYDLGQVPKRIPFKELFNLNLEPSLYDDIIGDGTDAKYRPFILNLMECFMDVSHKMELKKCETFDIVEDYGIRIMEYGNSGGGNFSGPYRCFIIKDRNGDNQLVSISISTYFTSSSNKLKTVLCVAIDDFDKSHHALQLVLDNHLIAEGNSYTIWHSGRISIGNIGSGRVDGLKKLIKEKCPELLLNERIVLGTVKNDGLLYVNNEEISMLIINLIKYSLIRDEYRDIIKKGKNNI